MGPGPGHPADDDVLARCLGQLASALRELPPSFLHALCCSSSRIGSAGLNCFRQENCISKAAEASPLSWLLATHHSDDPETICITTGPDDEELASLAVYGIAAWPASYALTFRATATRPPASWHACAASAPTPARRAWP
jgi:hypothetical protein